MSMRLTSFAISGGVFSLPRRSNACFASTTNGSITPIFLEFAFRHCDGRGHFHSLVAAGFFFAAAGCFVFGFLAPGARSASAFLFVGLAAAVFGVLAGAAVFAAFFGFVALDADRFFLGGMLRATCVRARVAFRESDL